MEIDLHALKEAQRNRARHLRSDHVSEARTAPSIWQYDYPVLSTLSRDIHALLREARTMVRSSANRAVDIGCNTSPYKSNLEAMGFVVKTMDLDLDRGADLAGRVEVTGLPDESCDLIICTQVLEHCSEPWRAAPEMFRILADGGVLVASVPHAWFYHPHPDDNWRYTPEGLSRLLTAAGFEVVSIRLQGGSVSSVFQIINFCLFGLLGRIGAPIFAISNLLGGLLDRIFFNPLFPINVAILVQKSAKS